MKTLVVVPTFDEAASILHTLDEISLYVPDAHVLVVDDASPDGTGRIVAARAETDPRISVLHRGARGGLGPAYRAGFARALDLGYDVVVEMDADGSHPAERLPAVLAALGGADLSIGSRWVREGRTDGWALHRRILSWGASAYVRRMLGSRTRDTTSGFRAFRAETLRRIDVGTTTSSGYGFQIETLHRVERCGLRVAEVPIVFAEREHGRSKMTLGIILEAYLRVAHWRRHPYDPARTLGAGSVGEHREVEGQPRAAERRFAGRHGATGDGRDVVHDRESQSAATRVAAAPVVETHETFEDARAFLRRNSGAVVVHVEDATAVDGAHGERNA